MTIQLKRSKVIYPNDKNEILMRHEDEGDLMYPYFIMLIFKETIF